ncbi:MAG: hypothetical protein FWD51_00340 [Betaproteobacteria bacterium]|nr:hypothetical protein [Betaproteobacteria bacterium]
MSRAIIGKLLGRKRQRGQAIFLALAAIVFLSLMTYAAFNISQMTHAKSQTMNAADAGAYTMALAVARDLNFMAYTNRAMVANHAVIGQLTSLASLSNMIYLASRDLQNLQYLRGIPYVGWILGEIGDAFQDLADTIRDDIWPMLENITEAQNYIIQGISYMQVLVRVASMADMLKVEEVIKANDPELKWATDGVVGGITSVNSADAAADFFNTHSRRQGDSGGGSNNCSGPNDDSDTSALDRMREVVNDSRDGFTVEREWVKAPPSISPRIKSSHLFHGGTKLSCNNNTWVGVDGFEMEICWCPFCFWNKKCQTIRLWLTGEVAGGSGASDWRYLSHGRLTSTGHQRAYNRRHYQRTYQLDWDGLNEKYDGLQPYYELTADPGEGEQETKTFTVAVYKPVKSSDTSNVTRTPNATQTFQTEAGNLFHLSEGRNEIYGVAAAHAYFRRPARSDNDPTAGRLPNEIYKDGNYATLFSPYWQARLTKLPAEVAALLMASD